MSARVSKLIQESKRFVMIILKANKIQIKDDAACLHCDIKHSSCGFN